MNPAPGFLKLRPNAAARLRLFCFPNAGGGAALLHSWLNGLAEVDLCPIYLPGRDQRRLEPAFVRMEPLIDAVTTAVEAAMDLPFAVFGHSAGAIMAFEMTRELRRRGLPMPRTLFVSAHAAPQIHRPAEPIHHLPDGEFIAQLIKRYDAIPSTVLLDKELMGMFTPVLKADMEILHTYAYQPDAPLPCPISALGGVLDSTVAAGQLEAWQLQTDNLFRLRMFPGKHFFLKEARPQVLSAIREDLSI